MGYESRRVRGTPLVLWRSTADSSQPVVVLPDGVLDLMWFRDQLVVAGPDTGAHRFEVATGSMTWGLRLAPGVAYALFGVSIEEMTDRRVELADLARVAPEWLAACAQNPGAALLRVHSGLARRVVPDHDVMRRATLVDRAARQGRSVAEAATALGTSGRTLRRFSHHVFGYGMKTLSSIHRFQNALTHAYASPTWADVAVSAGYADQAHFTRECRRLAGLTPSELARRS